MAHPPGAVRLGAGKDGRPFDIAVDDLAQGVFVPGAAGTGKTTTLTRLTDGVLGNGWSVAIVDCKAGGLRGPAEAVARSHGFELAVVDPQDDTGLGYDACTGEPSAVANKLIGAFAFAPEAEIFKTAVMEVLPLIVRALRAADLPISLDTIYEWLRPGVAKLGRASGDQYLVDRLAALDDDMTTKGYSLRRDAVDGMRRRLGALLEGAFGELYRRRPALDWWNQTSAPGVAYLALSATATPEDTELFGRIIAQDLKQLADARMRTLRRDEHLAPALVVFDEFAALRDPEQIVDLILQAREARLAIVLATQFIPEPIPIRRPALSAGVLIAHRVEAEDAEAIASQMGTRSVPFVTRQIDYETGATDKGSVRRVKEFVVHPDEIKALPIGSAAVLSRRAGRHDIVRVHRPHLDPQP